NPGRLRAARPDRPRRHGRRLPRPPAHGRPDRRPEADQARMGDGPGGPGAQRSDARPVPRRGAGGRPAGARSHRASLSRSKLTVQPARSEPMDTGPLPIMTYVETVITGGSHAPTGFYPHRPAGPPLRRRDPSAPPPAPRPRPQVPRGAVVDPVVLCRRAAHLALRCLPVFARCPLRLAGPAGPDRHPARLRPLAPPPQRRP